MYNDASFFILGIVGASIIWTVSLLSVFCGINDTWESVPEKWIKGEKQYLLYEDQLYRSVLDTPATIRRNVARTELKALGQ